MTQVLVPRQDRGPKKSCDASAVDRTERIRALVRAISAGRTQEATGDLLGVGQSMIGKVLKGTKDPGPTIERGLEKIGLPRSYIFGQAPAEEWERYIGVRDESEAESRTTSRHEVVEAFIADPKNDVKKGEAIALRKLFHRDAPLENMNRLLRVALETLREPAD